MNSLEIAQQATLVPIDEIAEQVGLQQDEVDPYGRYKAKISLSAADRLSDRPDGKLICVAGMTPTRAGEGKTTTLVGLTQGLGAIGKKSLAALREPSLGPVFGVKGGAAGGGWTQIVPMEDLNLHFTGDMHAIGAANNLLAAMIDAHIHHGNKLGIDPNNITWRRAIDMNDRALRNNVVALGGKTNGLPRETGFDITAASEVMALMAVTRDLTDLRERLGRITIGYSFDGRPITAEDLGAAGSMTVLLKEALKPNLVQTLEGQPCLMHTGPFANIASGNNSLVADRIGMKLADYIVTESGFGADMGMEKFFNIVCRFGGLTPSAVVLVCTVRAIRHHAGGDDGDLEEGFANVAHHLQTIQKFGLPAVVAVNRRPGDSDEDVEAVRRLALQAGAHGAEVNEGFEKGGKGVTKLAEAVVAACDAPSNFKLLYEDSATIPEKIETVAKEIYGADGVNLLPAAQAKVEQFTRDGLGHFPVCMAKTQLSLTSDPTRLGAPKGFTIDVRDIRAYTGAGWLVPLCGDIMQMPGLGAQPAALSIDIDKDGNTVGLF
ncbi:MAG: formate--tetrahydrofolate ligase [Solirubrobacteraceae bacterium]|nr:formate--tetrahydrofolate ligase [Solirubrobacteraceae bacterium]